MSLIFQHKWICPFSGWTWKLDIIPAGAAAIDRDVPSNYRQIPPGAIQVKKMKKGFDTIRLGMPVTPQLEIEVDLSLLPDKALQTDYADLHKAFKNPLVRQTVSCPTTPCTFAGGDLTLDTGTIYDLYCDFEGNSSFSGYKHVESFIQLKRPDDEYDSESQILKIKPEWFIRTALEGFDFNQMFFPTESDHTDKRVIETVLSAFTNTFLWGHLVGTDGDEANFHFLQYSRLWAWFEGSLVEIFKRLMRRSTWETLVLPKPQIIYYGQLYDGSGNRDEALAFEHLYILSMISNYDSETNISGGFLNITDKSESMFRYDNLYDYLDDLYQESLTVPQWDYNVVDVHPIKETAHIYTMELDDVDNIKIKHSLFSMNSVKASMNEIIDNDIDYYEINSAKSRKEGSYTLPIVHSNHPTDTAYGSGSYKYMFELLPAGNGSKIYWTLAKPPERPSPVHINNFYYLDSPDEIFELTALPVPIRVHEHCKVRLKSSPLIISDSIIGNGYLAIPYENDYPSVLQSNFKAMHVAKALHGCFKPNNPGLEVELSYDKITYLNTASSWWNYWNYEGSGFLFDVSTEIDSDYDYLHDTWLIQESEINFQTGKVSLKMYEADIPNAV